MDENDENFETFSLPARKTSAETQPSPEPLPGSSGTPGLGPLATRPDQDQAGIGQEEQESSREADLQRELSRWAETLILSVGNYLPY